jgi:hypothetical protein
MVVEGRVVVFAAALRFGDRQEGRNNLGAVAVLIRSGGPDAQSL